jgi:translation initiation factor 2B subunit (eIF-2B alpha/beta/delta family)
VGHAVGARLVIREGAPREVWDGSPAGVEVRNPYFESTPLDLVTSVITDAGVLGAGMVPELCDSTHDPFLLQALEQIRW